jgi:DNA-binding NtrC family response regulator
MMSGHGTVETAVEATRYGAIDFVEKPLSMAKLLSTVKSALSRGVEGGRPENRRPREQPVGNSLLVQRLKQRLLELRDSSEPVFFTGPQGSGKRIWADFLCATSGGVQVFDGGSEIRDLVPLASNLYIDEIAELTAEQQTQLRETILANNRGSRFRFVLASRFSCDELLQQEAVDPHLARLWTDAVEIPALEDHIEDIPELLQYYVNWYSDNEQLPYRHFNVAAQNLLRNHRWRGDIKQLKQFVRTMLTNGNSEQIELEEIEQALRLITATEEMESGNKMQISVDMSLDLREAREAFEREYLSRHLALCGYNMTELARRVGQERTHLYRKLKSLGLQAKKQ